MGSQDIQYVFGPVPSRRLGRSLGVDLVPFKTCSHDCVYCQLGRTTRRTIERSEYAPTETVIEQLRAALSGEDRPDSVTLAGSGEPTLHIRLGEVIGAIKSMTDVPVTILTNGSLLDEAEARKACALADRVVPSLDAGSEAAFQRVNRPAEGLTLARHVEGLEAFRREFRGQLWLEIMLVADANDSDDEIDAMRRLAERIGPDRIQLNTVIRPPADAEARAVDPERMAEISKRFGARAEVIADYQAKHFTATTRRRREEVLAALQRRPCTLSDVAAGLGIHRNEAIKFVTQLLKDGLIVRVRRGEQEYYQSPEHDGGDGAQGG